MAGCLLVNLRERRVESWPTCTWLFPLDDAKPKQPQNPDYEELSSGSTVLVVTLEQRCAAIVLEASKFPSPHSCSVTMPEDSEDEQDFSTDLLFEREFDPAALNYNGIRVESASMTGKALTLLANAVFNSAFVLGEWIDRGFLNFADGLSGALKAKANINQLVH